jgi:hypothetical protein
LGKHIAIFVIGSITIGLLVAGCGSSGDSAEAQPIDKATYAKRANKICEKVTSRLFAEAASMSSKAAAEPGYNYTKAQTVIVKESMIPRLEEELQEIRALRIPGEVRKDVKAFVAASKRLVDWVKARPKAAIESNSGSPYAAVELAGIKFGVTECPIAVLKTG